MKYPCLRVALVAMSLFLALAARGDLVHVYQQTLAGGVATQLSEQTLETGSAYSTTTAPTKSGYIFTCWSISASQSIDNRDRLGRAREVVSYTLYEETTLSANYLPVGEDTDDDGVADGYEIYWYGDLSKDAASDTDNDGFTFAEELASGLDPLMPDESIEGGVEWADGALLQYNPDNLQAYVVRSEPEGALFATQSDYLKPGQQIPIPSVSGNFAYWMVDGARQADRLGRAKDVISVTMPNAAIEIVALAEDDEVKRNALYWYGDASVSMDSDTDGDGFTFAKELAAGTDPLMPDESLPGGIVWADGSLLLYNPENLQPYTVRSEPEGALFATQSDYLNAGQQIPIPSISGNFAYWTVDGVRQADRLGRARDTLSIMMPERAIEIVAVSESDDVRRNALYWYGDVSVAQESDTDGDGYTFAEELAAGTDPLMVDESLPGGIVWADGELHEVNLQPYEQVQGTVVGNEYSELFTSPVAGNGGTSRTFDGAATPTVVDLNGDGRFDLVVETSKSGRTVFLNEGGAGNPQFIETAWNPNWLEPLNNAKTNTIDGLSFDVEPINAVSWSFADVDKDGIVDLLVADVDGRIWYYRGTWNGEEGFANFELSTLNFKLQHKVWGGSYPGFANGLQIAAVDWDDDGDVDLVCGTAEGKLMLLNDPRVGRPVNLRAEAGATSVVLMWDPNVNSRVRGYGIYRSADSNEFAKIENMCPLPRYRDVPPTIQDWWYRVTGKSRLYVAGNSTPVESESIPTDAIYVQMRPSVWLTDTSSFTDTNVEVVVSMNNSMGISADGFSMTFTYDANVLQPVEMKRSGLTVSLEGGAQSSESAGVGTWTFTATGGEIGIGAGEFLRLVFYVKPVHDVTETTVSLTAATVRSEAGQAVSLELPKSAKIDISDANPLQPAVVSIQAGNAAAATGEEFDLPFTITSTEVLTSGVFTVSFDESMFELRGVNGGELRRDGGIAPYRVVATDSGSLRFAVKEQHSVATNFSTTVSLSGAHFVDCNGFEVTADDSQGTVLIKNSHPILPAVVSVSTEDRKVDTLETVVVPFKVMSSEALANGSFMVTWDPAVLELSGTSGTSGASGTGGYLTVSSTGDFSISFLAKDQHDISKTLVRLTSATVTDVNGFTVTPAVPVVSTVLIHDAHPLIPAVVSMNLGDVAVETESELDMTLSITSTEALTALKMTLAYDTSLLELRSGTLEYNGTVPSSVTLRFYAKENHTVGKTAVTITPVSATDKNGFTNEITLPASVVGNVILADSNPWQPATVSVGIAGAKVDTRSEFAIPVTITSNETLTNFAATVTWDENALEFRGVAGAAIAGQSPYRSGNVQIVGEGGNFTLNFYAKDQHEYASAEVGLSGMSAMDNHGLAANAIADAAATVVIHDAFPLMPAVVSMNLGDVAVETDSEFDMTLSITSTEALTALKMTLAYDTSLLELRSGTLEYNGTVPSSATLRFYAKENHTVDKTVVTITPVSAKDKNGFTTEITLPASVVGNVILADSNPWQPATVSVGIAGAKVDTRSEFSLPVTITSNETLTNFAATVTWDENALEFRGVAGAAVSSKPPYQTGNVKIAGNGNNFTLNFYAKDQHEYASAEVGLSGMSAMDSHGLAANAIADATATVVIHDAFPLMPAVVSMNLGDVAVETESEFDMTLSITSTEALNALKMALAYDTSLLELRSGTLEYNGTVSSSATLRFYAKENHTVGKTAVTITPVSATDKNGFTTEITLPASVVGNVILADSNPWQPATVSVGIAGAKVDTRSEFAIPVTITSNETLTNFAATVTWDENALEFRGVTGAAVSSKPPYQTGNVKIAGNGNNFTLNFYAKDQHEYAAAEVGLSGMSAMDNHGLAANAIADATATVVIHDAYPLLPAEVAIKAGAVSAKTRNAFEVPVTVTSSKVLTDMGVTVSWDESVLELKGVGGAAVSAKPPYQIVANGDVPTVITLTFYAKDQHTVKETTITLSDGAAVCTDGLDANVTTENGKVMLTDSNPPVAVNMAIATLDARAESGKPFVIPLGATTDGNLAELTATVEWNANMLTFNGADGATVVSSSASSATLTFPASGTHNLFDLDFTAKTITDLRANTTVRITAANGMGANGLAAKLTTTLPVESTVLIVRNINKYDPGDIDGDGKYTDADMTLLQNYIKYLSIVSAAPQLASRYASWKLSGKALKAADVNIDGKIDANDMSMLVQFIASWKEANK